MAIKIKQGDAYSIPVEVTLDGAAVAIADIEQVEFYVGGYRKLYPADVSYDGTDGCFYVPLSQAETFAWPADSSVELDVRVKFAGGRVEGIDRKLGIGVVDAVSQEVL